VARVTSARGAGGGSTAGVSQGPAGSADGAVPPSLFVRRGRTPVPSGLAVLAAALIALLAALRISVPYFAITPGPAPDVVQLIAINGAETQEVNGRLLLTTVSLHQIRVAEAIRGWFDPGYQIVSKSTIFQTGETERENEQRTTLQMDESQEYAAAAALRYLRYNVKITPIGARVADLTPGAPAVKVLKLGDLIVGADEQPVRSSQELRAVIARHEVGETISIRIRRGDKTLTVTTKTIGNSSDPTKPIIGVTLDDLPRVELPLAVDIDSLGIGGPSAGLMFALGIVDLLDTADLAKGRTIAGTGAIELDGTVLPVGGIRQKVAGARSERASLFLAPLDELAEACSKAGDLPVVGVRDLKEAVSVLRGDPLPDGRICS
jgi:PDZ domain-containing protein